MVWPALPHGQATALKLQRSRPALIQTGIAVTTAVREPHMPPERTDRQLTVEDIIADPHWLDQATATATPESTTRRRRPQHNSVPCHLSASGWSI